MKNTILAIMAASLLSYGCSDPEPAYVYSTCQDPDPSTGGNKCLTPGGVEGVCLFGECAIQCDTAADCPQDDCRAGHCLNTFCAFLNRSDGIPCASDAGTCDNGQCSTN